MHPIVRQIFLIVEEHKFSQASVCEKAGYNHNYLSNIYDRPVDPGLRKIEDILHVLGYSLKIEKTHEPLIPLATSYKSLNSAFRRAARERRAAALEHFKSRGSLVDYERPVLRDTDEPARRSLLRPKRLRNVAGGGRGGDSAGLPPKIDE